MQNGFAPDEWSILSKQLGLVASRQSIHSSQILIQDLLNHEKCEKLLNELRQVIHAPNLKVTASLVSKRYAFLATASSLYAMTIFNKALNMSAENCVLDYQFSERLWRSKMPIIDLSYSTALEHEREYWREHAVKMIFAENLAKVWQIFVDVTKVHPRILWENTAVRVYSLYEKRMQKINDPQLQRRIIEDFNYLTQLADASVFGIDHNLLKKFNFKKIPVLERNEDVRFRKSCCFYYKASDPVEYCSTCPLIHPELKKTKVKHV